MINYEYHVTCSICGSLYGFWASTEDAAQEEVEWHAHAWGHYPSYHQAWAE